MNELVLNLIKAAIGLGAVYGFYWWFLRKETSFVLNRSFLLLGLIVAFVSPWVQLTSPFQASAYSVSHQLAPNLLKTHAFVGNESIGEPINYWLIVYLSGVLLLLFRLLYRLIQFIIIYHKSTKFKYQGFTVAIVASTHTPASFFNTLFLTQQQFDSTNLNTIVIHENYHKQQYHSLDILLIEILIIVQWFNPIIWLYKTALLEQHEFGADRKVVSEGNNKFQYQHLLIEKATGYNINDFMNYFNNSLLKSRIKMMNKIESKSWLKANYVFALPLLVLLAVGLFPSQNALAQQSNKVHTEVDKMPEYPGGLDAMYHSIAKQILYPSEARNSNIEGRVFVSFVVNKNGDVTDVKVDKSEFKDNVTQEIVVVGYNNNSQGVADETKQSVDALAESAKNAVSQLNRFSPGVKSGKKVSVKITIPVAFKLG